MASDPTQDPPQPYLCVFGTPGDDTIEISTTSITLNGGAAFSIPAGISEIHVHGEDGNDSLTEDAGVTPPVWYYGGDGNDTVTGQKYGDTIDDGDAGPPELRADGPPTITEGQPATLALRRHWATRRSSTGTFDWGDGTYEPVSTTSPSHYYTSGTGVYTVSVSALDSDGGYDTCREHRIDRRSSPCADRPDRRAEHHVRRRGIAVMARCLDYRHGLQDSAVNRRNELLDNCHRRRWIKFLPGGRANSRARTTTSAFPR